MVTTNVVSVSGMATCLTADHRGEGIDEVVMWSSTKHGRIIIDAYLVDEDYSSCSSVWGLCE